MGSSPFFFVPLEFSRSGEKPPGHHSGQCGVRFDAARTALLASPRRECRRTDDCRRLQPVEETVTTYKLQVRPDLIFTVDTPGRPADESFKRFRQQVAEALGVSCRDSLPM